VYSSEVERLARYLIGANHECSEVCRFLVLDTFAKFKASAIIFVEISIDGHVRAESSFGIPEENLRRFGTVPIGTEIPGFGGFRSNHFSHLSVKESKVAFPMLHEGEGVPKNVASFVVCPVLPYGGLAVALDSSPDLDNEFEMFFRAVGALAFLHSKNLQSGRSTNLVKKQRSSANEKAELTGRQTLIKNLMENGHTNHAIAKELGYSESLIRQETMNIYSILKIDGRQELLKKSGT
jgi:DNA-binding CsgD family transcriptional regulator